MISISNYQLIENREFELFTYYVRSAEKIPCPCCGGTPYVIGSRKRKAIQSSGEAMMLVVRRLRCPDCGQVHDELPDILVPYKRYTAESIEAALSHEQEVCVAADDSTIRRWRRWFEPMVPYWQGCLQAIAAEYFSSTLVPLPSTTGSALQRIWHYTGSHSGWLGRVVRSISNANFWVHTRSACLSG